MPEFTTQLNLITEKVVHAEVMYIVTKEALLQIRGLGVLGEKFDINSIPVVKAVLANNLLESILLGYWNRLVDFRSDHLCS